MKVHPRLKHLSQSGRMGEMIACFDWDKTPVGNPETWSQSLLSILGVVLNNKIPMYVLWGKEQINFYNDAYAEILDTKHPKALGAKSIETWPEIWDTIGPLFADVYNGNSVYYENMPLVVNVTGKPVQKYFTFSFTPIHIEDGSVGGVLDTVIDTTVEQNQKEMLQKSEEMFRSYHDLSPNPFFSIDTDWTFTYMNPSALLTLSRSREQVIGKNIWEAFPGLEESVFGDAYKRSMNGENVSVEGYYSLYDHWYAVTAYPLYPGIAVTFQDITERKFLENNLNKAVAARDDFLSIASHELKTPITSWKIQTQGMMREMKKNSSLVFEPARLQKYFQQSDKQVTRITRLVDDMLDVSRIASGRLQFQLAPVDFKNILLETLERMTPQFESSPSGKPHVHFRGDHFVGNWDAFRMEQVINNLFTNALRYGEGNPIRVELEDLGDSIKLTVVDQGKGIFEADKKVIFERFMRAGNSDFQQGLGLGLFITKEIVSGHKGLIDVQSAPGNGSEFIVILPKN